MEKPYAIAYWLLPEKAAREVFTNEIRELARRFQAPAFEPHVTVFIASENSRNPAEVLRDRADALGQRATNLKKLVDSWQPLYESLDARQKLRLRLVTMLALREMKDAVASRHWDSEDEDENE